MVSALCLAAKSGVDVRIITPHQYDKFWVHFTTRSYYNKLIRAGVRIYEYTPGFIHAKSYVADDKTAVIGTVNLDYRSLVHHFENGVWMYRTDAVCAIKADIDETLALSEEISLEKCKKNLFSRLLRAVARVFAPLL